MVKRDSGEDTWRVASWENSSVPGSFFWEAFDHLDKIKNNKKTHLHNDAGGEFFCYNSYSPINININTIYIVGIILLCIDNYVDDLIQKYKLCLFF